MAAVVPAAVDWRYSPFDAYSDELTLTVTTGQELAFEHDVDSADCAPIHETVVSVNLDAATRDLLVRGDAWFGRSQNGELRALGTHLEVRLTREAREALNASLDGDRTLEEWAVVFGDWPEGELAVEAKLERGGTAVLWRGDLIP